MSSHHREMAWDPDPALQKGPRNPCGPRCDGAPAANPPFIFETPKAITNPVDRVKNDINSGFNRTIFYLPLRVCVRVTNPVCLNNVKNSAIGA